MDMVTALIVMAGIYYGAMYGGSITSILVNIPGEAASVVTCIDGYKMARKGRAGPALGMSAIGSFIGGTVSVVAVMLISPFLAETALKFGAPEMFALLFFAFVCIVFQMTDIGNVTDITYLVSQMGKITEQDIERDGGACVS